MDTAAGGQSSGATVLSDGSFGAALVEETESLDMTISRSVGSYIIVTHIILCSLCFTMQNNGLCKKEIGGNPAGT